MTIKFGRVGTDVALADPQTWSRGGDRVSMAGWASNTSVADATTLTEQLLGLVDNPDEPVIACTWTYEPWFDGYYRVLNVNVPGDPERSPLGDFRYQIELQRIADGDSPRIDSTLVGALLANANSVTSGTLAHRVPGDGHGYYARGGALTSGANDLLPATANNRTTETGVLAGGRRATISAVTNGYASFECAPADYYDGHCTIRSGTTLRRVIGQRLKRLPLNWEISNGLIRVTPTTAGRIITEVYNGSAWEDPITWWYGTTSNSFVAPGAEFRDISILRNSPEQCVIRASLGASNSTDTGFGVMQWDIGIKRGSYHATIRQAWASGLSTGAIALGNSTASAATAITGGLRQTSNSAAGNRWVLALVHPTVAVTNNTTQGSVTLNATAPTSALVCVGYEFNGTGAATSDAAQEIVNEFYYPITERMVPRVR